MPEQISKYPDVTIQVLQGAGGRCGEGAEQRILTACPKERFCSMPTGEICVYGIEEIAKMTQINPADLRPFLGGETARSVGGAEAAAALGATLILGLVLGRWSGLRKREGS